MIKLILGNCLEKMKEIPDNSVDSVVTDPPYGLSFMGKSWDYDVPKVEIWKECLRVLKPGGHLLSFAGTRTQHRMAVNIEDAGFEIRDMIAWVYGSGFPKSLNIGKAVDKLQGNERESKKVKGKIFTGSNNNIAGESGEYEITKGNSQYEGWGTALKPALEPITVARKPISEKNIAENVLKWGTGGINIDECRVGAGKEKTQKQGVSNSLTQVAGRDTNNLKEYPENLGRFPANFIHDGSDEVVELFPNTKSQGHWSKTKTTGFGEFGNGKSEYLGVGEKDKVGGSASRFFYCAKASKSERNRGCEEMPLKHYLKENKMGGEGDTMLTGSGNPRDCRKRNNHPTVKPIKLMEYLVTLVTPKNGTVLDPFMGSGSTGIACRNKCFSFVGIELDPEYLKIAKKRINKPPAQVN